MVLAHLCASLRDFAQTQFIAVTIDHGLRAQSKNEAAQTRQLCKQLGLAHEILTWDHQDEPVESAIQERAREARYQLLCRYADERAASAILTAHSLDDQAETVLMRLMRGAGPVGLGAMAVERAIALDAGAPIRLIRPMLGITRAQITNTAKTFNQPYLDDPSNENHEFERVRTRALLGALDEQDILSPKALAQTARKSALAANTQRRAMQQAADRLELVFHHWGGATFSARRLNDLGLAVDHVAICVARILYAVGAGSHAPDPDRAAKALKAAITQGQSTLAGCLIKRDHEQVCVFREPASFAGRESAVIDRSVLLSPGQSVVWDKRFIISAGQDPIHASGRPGNGWVLNSATKVLEKCEKASARIPKIALSTVPFVERVEGPTGICASVFQHPSAAFSVKSLLRERFVGDVHRFVTSPPS